MTWAESCFWGFMLVMHAGLGWTAARAYYVGRAEAMADARFERAWQLQVDCLIEWGGQRWREGHAAGRDEMARKAILGRCRLN